MITFRSPGPLMSASLISSIAASLCCIVPVAGILAGTSSLATWFSWMEPARPYLIGISLAAIALAWYLKLRPARVTDADCDCETKRSSFVQSKTFLGVVTIISILMASFPLYAGIFNDASKTSPELNTISFYDAPLVCQAAPSIGCGSKSKFMLLDLEKNADAVEGAWLNRKGTMIAVQWRADATSEKRRELIRTVSTSYGIRLSETDASHASNFPDKKEWYKGKEVDELSKEEAAIIARNTIESYRKAGIVDPSFEKQFQADIEKIYADLFLSISSYKDLTMETYNKVQDQIQRAGEKWVGKGKMPRVKLCIFDEDNKSCEKDQSCNSDSTNDKSCCEKN